MADKQAADFQDIQQRFNDLSSQYSARNTQLDAIERMILCDWQDKPNKEGVKLTMSTSARDSVMGARDLMTAATPQFYCPTEKMDEDSREKVEPLEKAAAAMWFANGRLHENPLEYDAVYSAVAFGQIDACVTLVDDLLTHAKEGGGKSNAAAIKRLERVVAQTPTVFEVWDPRDGYPERSPIFGLTGYGRKTKIKAGSVIDQWGDIAVDAGVDPAKRAEDLDYCDWWDDVYHVAWIDGKNVPLLNVEHGLPSMPIISQIVNGSTLHRKLEDQVQPLLYGMHKSASWERENLILTVIATNIFAVAANAAFVYKTTDATRSLDVDWSIVGGVVNILQGETLEPLVKAAVDGNMMQLYQMMAEQGERSTIFRQALGQPLSGQRSFSETALLNQSGRLPLVGPQRKGGAALGRIMEKAFELIKYAGGKASIKGQSKVVDIAAADIPDDLIMECKLDISLPQDDRTNAAMVAQLTDPKDPKVPLEWALENMLQINQPKEMIRQIYKEKLMRNKLEMELQRQIMQAQAQYQQQTAINAGGMPQGQPMPQGMPPEQAALAQGQVIPPNAGQGVPGMPMPGPMDAGPGPMDAGQGLPPEMMGGM